MLGFVTILLFVLACHAELLEGGDQIDGRYKVYEVQASSTDEFDALRRFEDQGLLDFWHSPFSPTAKADIMVDENNADIRLFHELLENSKIKSKILVNDLTKFIKEKESNLYNISKKKTEWLRDDTLTGARRTSYGLQMGEYHSYEEILAFMEHIQRQLSSSGIELRSIGRTVEGRDIRGIQFGRPYDRTRRVVWIGGGFHAREWTSIHTAVYFIQHIANELQSGADRSQLARYLESVDVLIFPCLNPDGYEFTRTEPRNPSVRFWRKNRSAERCGLLNGNRRCCRGVDLNRNFDFRFAETGTSYFPCSEIYHGAGAFSEPETRAVRDAVMQSDLRGRLDAFVDMHAYSQLWIYPYSHKRFAYPVDVDELKSVARRAVSAIGEKFGTSYMYGTGPEIIYAYAGGSTDWAKQAANIKYTYTIELRPSYWSWNGFILEKTQLIPTARETFDGIMVLFETIVKKLNATHQTLNNTDVTSALLKNRQNTKTRMRANSLAPHNNSINHTATTTITTCEDDVPYCAMWLQDNAALCQLSRASMQRNCALSCRLCI